MELLVLVHGILEEGELVLEIGLFEQPLGVVAHELALLGVLGHEVLDLLGEGGVGLLEDLQLLLLLLVPVLHLLEVRRHLGVTSPQLPALVLQGGRPLLAALELLLHELLLHLVEAPLSLEGRLDAS